MNGEQIRILLASEFKKRNTSNSSYSLRAFARDLSLSPTTLCQTLSGKRKITLKTLLKVSIKLQLPDDQVRHLAQQLTVEALTEKITPMRERMPSFETELTT